MFDAPICGYVLLIANILCLFSGWTSWHEHIFCCVDFVHHIVLFRVNPINKTSRMIFCYTRTCLVGFYICLVGSFGSLRSLPSFDKKSPGLRARKAIPWGIWGRGPVPKTWKSEELGWWVAIQPGYTSRYLKGGSGVHTVCLVCLVEIQSYPSSGEIGCLGL